VSDGPEFDARQPPETTCPVCGKRWPGLPKLCPGCGRRLRGSEPLAWTCGMMALLFLAAVFGFVGACGLNVALTTPSIHDDGDFRGVGEGFAIFGFVVAGLMIFAAIVVGRRR